MRCSKRTASPSVVVAFICGIMATYKLSQLTDARFINTKFRFTPLHKWLKPNNLRVGASMLPQ